MHLYLWFSTSSDFSTLPLMFCVWGGVVASGEFCLIRYTSASFSSVSWLMRSVLLLLGGMLSAFVFGGTSLLSAGLILGLSSMTIMSLFIDRIFVFLGWSLSLLPAGTPILLGPPVVALELLSFFLRLGTLAIRLLANILVGGIIVHLMFGSASLMMSLLLGSFFVYEMMVFGFQMYLFGGLSLLYLSESHNVDDFCVS